MEKDKLKKLKDDIKERFESDKSAVDTVFQLIDRYGYQIVEKETTRILFQTSGMKTENGIHLDDYKGCRCSTCLEENEVWNMIPGFLSIMVLCEKCGNKRCPHAKDHRNKCTNSNAPGQPGSNYSK